MLPRWLHSVSRWWRDPFFWRRRWRRPEHPERRWGTGSAGAPLGGGRLHRRLRSAILTAEPLRVRLSFLVVAARRCGWWRRRFLRLGGPGFPSRSFLPPGALGALIDVVNCSRVVVPSSRHGRLVRRCSRRLPVQTLPPRWMPPLLLLQPLLPLPHLPPRPQQR